MKLKKSSRLAGSLLLIGSLALSAGCGYKTNPVPPQTVVPKAIEDLQYSHDDKGARLTWTYPIETIKGNDIPEIMSFELFRAEIPLKDFCGGCPIPFGEPMELPGGMTDVEKRVTGEHLSGMLRSGNKYFFKMRSRTSYLAASDDSNIISFVFHTPAAAPAGVKTSVLDNGVAISWAPVTSLIDGNAADLPLSYQVERSMDGKNFAPIGSLLSTTSYVDNRVERGKTYHYQVRSSMNFEGAKVGGSLSKAVKTTIKDRVPPGVVIGVTVVASMDNVRVFWDSSKATDLAGYRVYRRTEGESSSTRVGEVSRSQTIFIDKNVSSAATVYYAVSAFDTDGNEGKKSEEATTRH